MSRGSNMAPKTTRTSRSSKDAIAASATISRFARVTKPDVQQRKGKATVAKEIAAAKFLDETKKPNTTGKPAQVVASRAQQPTPPPAPAPAATAAPGITQSRKRKVREAIADDSSSSEAETRPRRTTQTKAAARPTKRARARGSAAAPDSGAVASALLERLNIRAASAAVVTASSSSASTPAWTTAASTAVTSSAEDGDDEDNNVPTPLPTELADLVRLHVALLKTLSLHRAHHGSASPADIQALAPNVARLWGRRAVTADDVALCLGMHASGCGLILSEYGRRRVCVEADGTRSMVDEDGLNTAFEAELRRRWEDEERDAAQGGRARTDVGAFAARLPRAAIAQRSGTGTDGAPAGDAALAKGKQTLLELKQGIVARRAEVAAKKQQLLSSRPDAPMTDADAAGQAAPKLSLLDRIRLKQLQNQTGADAGQLTPEQRQRASALQRAGDVAAVIGMLCQATGTGIGGGGGARMSWAMAALLEKVRDSLRVPVSREEGAACVRLLAAEVCPAWIRVVTLGGREMVVVTPAARPGNIEALVKGLI